MKKAYYDAEHGDLECVICADKITDATSTDCGHLFCKKCITDWLALKQQEGRRQTCPICRQTVKHVHSVTYLKGKIKKVRPQKDAKLKQSSKEDADYEPFSFQRMIEQLRENYGFEVGDEVGCMYVGCDWRGFQKHRDWHHKRCVHRIETCTLCHGRYSKTEMKNHLPQCPCRPVTCQYCNEEFEHCRLRTHQKFRCPLNFVHCSGCEARMPVCELQTHLRRECPERLVDCSVCKSRIAFKNLNNHICVPPPPPSPPAVTEFDRRFAEVNGKPSIFLRGCRALTCSAFVENN